jgi:thiamine biosynthesis protein ThiI
MEAIAVTDDAASLPVMRPCIGLDKEEIIAYARKIDTYDTSVLPYEDCCTVFTPRHPKTHPSLSDVIREEGKLDLAAIEAEALSGRETLTVPYDHR